MKPSAASSVFQALDNARMTWRHYAFWLVASGGALLDGFSVVSLGIALPLLKRDFVISPLLVGLIGSALVLGAVAGAAIGGIAADKFGRKRVFIADMTIIGIAGLIAAIAPSPWLILAAEFLLGVGVGSDFPTSASYVSELMPKAARSRMTVATIAMQSVGMVGAALVAMGILRFHASTVDWRFMLGAGGAIALVFLLGRLWAPESPRWLAIKGRFDEAKVLLNKLSCEFGDPEAVTVQTLAAAESRTASQQPHAAGFSTLFSARFRDKTLLISLPWMLMDVATYGVGLFTPVILAALHFGSSNAGPIAADLADAKGSAVVDLFLLFGFLASLFAVPRFGRIPMQVAGFAGMALGMLLLLCAALIGEKDSLHLAFVIGGFVLFNFAMNAGPNATTFTLAPALFPTSIRGAAAGFGAALAKVGATFGTFVVPQLNAAWGLTGVVGLMLIVSVAGLVATAALSHAVNEEGRTRRGNTQRSGVLAPR